MGYPKQCPGCGRFGTPKLEGYCKICYPNRHFMDRDDFKEQLFRFQQISSNVVIGALAEVGETTADNVKPKDRSVVLNICQRRLPQSRRKHIESDDSTMGSDDYLIRKHGEYLGGYDVEKGVPEIER